MSPYDDLHCLLVQPQFSLTNYWNFVDSAKTIGAKTPAPPLGLLTVAALLPRQWSLQLVDLNVRAIEPEEWHRADVVCVGGMIAQQPGILEIIARAKDEGKYVVVGGPDPTSQPEVYQDADALVLGEGEATIPLWLESWRNGQRQGVFTEDEKPDVTKSPIPRFDLVCFDDYVDIGVQFSRGCPFNCEFCDIIELYGRKPRVKTPEQFVAELEALYQLGYRGWIDISDDNFIGNKRQIKLMLEHLEAWCKQRKYPFYFSTEASMNLADDEALMAAMQRVDFRFVFMGIETPDADLLGHTQKRVNAMKPIVERIHKVYDYGMSVSAGFILGFDNEKAGNEALMISCIEETGIILAMVGLLTALPNTQLTRRLAGEGRLIASDNTLLTSGDDLFQFLNAEALDQTAGGLNFVTTRDRVVVYQELINVINAVYNPKAFMDRVLFTTQRLRPHWRHLPNWWEFKRMVRGLGNMAVWMTRNRSVRRYYWRNTLRTLLMGFEKFAFAQTMMSSYIHIEKQSRHILDKIEVAIDFATNDAAYPRSVSLMADAYQEPVSP